MKKQILSSRLLLRQDNADLRLTEKGAAAGLFSGDRLTATHEKKAQLEEGIAFVNGTRLEGGIPIAKWMRRPESSWTELDEAHREKFSPATWELIEIEVKYEGYLKRQHEMVERTAKLEHKAIPAWLDYHEVSGLKREAQHKLDQIKPQTLGQAGRVSGITPADIALLAVWIERGGRATATAKDDAGEKVGAE